MLDDKVAILLSTYNGGRYLPEQLDSLVSQTHTNWVIYASDDGSSDDTLSVLERYRKQLGEHRLVVLSGPRKGFAANFLSLLKDPGVSAPFFAFCDQDDIWSADKLERAVAWAKTVPADVPSLYCSRTQLVDEAGNPIGYSPLFSKPPCFANALVQSIAGGNTMLFNARTRELLRETSETTPLITHDWWSYIVVTGCGGQVFYDPQARIGYRQHGNNLIGANSSFTDRLVRVKRMLSGTFREWNDAHIRAIRPLRHLLAPSSVETLDLFEQARTASLAQRLLLIRRSGVCRQTVPGNLALLAATIIQRL